MRQPQSHQFDIKLVLFDWFGVMVVELTKELIKTFKLNEDQQQALAAINFLADHKYVEVKDIYAVQAQLMTISTGQPHTPQDAHAWLEQHINPDPYLLKRIKQLRDKGIKVAISSNAASDHHQNLVNRGMLNHFDQIYVSSTIGHTKPNADFFKYILNDQGAKPTQTLFIDDMMKNIEGAQRLGIYAEQYGQLGNPESIDSILKKYHLM